MTLGQVYCLLDRRVGDSKNSHFSRTKFKFLVLALISKLRKALMFIPSVIMLPTIQTDYHQNWQDVYIIGYYQMIYQATQFFISL